MVIGSTLTACSSSTTGNADPAPSSATQGPSTGTPGGHLTAPPVPNPLDVSKYEQNPCGVLTQAQAAEVAKLETTRLSSGASGPICRWQDADHNSIGFSFVHGGGLSDAYGYQESNSGYFKVIPQISGYPAVLSGTTDDRNRGGCQVIVGVRNDEEMTVYASLRPSSPNYGDPCSLAQKATEAALLTVKGGA